MSTIYLSRHEKPEQELTFAETMQNNLDSMRAVSGAAEYPVDTMKVFLVKHGEHDRDAANTEIRFSLAKELVKTPRKDIIKGRAMPVELPDGRRVQMDLGGLPRERFSELASADQITLLYLEAPNEDGTWSMQEAQVITGLPPIDFELA
jgi:hypothetical protein